MPPAKPKRQPKPPKVHRRVAMDSPARLKGQRRHAYDVMVEAGPEGIENAAFLEAMEARIGDEEVARLRASVGGIRRALWDTHLMLRTNAPNWGLRMVQLEDRKWALVKQGDS